MNNPLINNGIRFIILILAQVYVFDRIQLNGFINPYIYVMFVMMLPYDTRKWLLLASAFLAGITIDIFNHTPGLHAAATVFLAFSRPGIIRLVGRREDVQPGHFPNIRDTGPSWFVAYTLILVFLHHLVLFFLEAFRMNEFFLIILKVLINAALSSGLILIVQFLFYGRRTD
jgi:hypothetical protein